MIIKFDNIELYDWKFIPKYGTWFRVDIDNIPEKELLTYDSLIYLYQDKSVCFFGKLYKYNKLYTLFTGNDHSMENSKDKIDQFLLKYDKIKSFL